MKLILVVAASLFFILQGNAQCANLFFSECIEGSSSNRALEIYNPTGLTVDLSDYVIYRANNGAVTPSDSLFPSGLLGYQEVFVAANPAANATILGEADTTHSICFYNGDDAIWLKKISSGDTLDVIGQIGVDPGAGWPVGSGATNNTTLVRQIGVTFGTTNWALGSTQWDTYPIDMDDSLGKHTAVTGLLTSNSFVSETACNSYTSPSGNYTWTSSGMYVDTIPNAAGCDSIMTINLTIITEVFGTDVQVVCDSFTWIDGNTYTNSTSTPQFTLMSSGGCDSIVTLNLTINSVDVSVTSNPPVLTANASGAAYQWLDCDAGFAAVAGATNQSFTPAVNGNYAVEIEENGCVDTTTCFIVEWLDLDDLGALRIDVYPNPTAGVVVIESAEMMRKVQVLNLDGTTVSHFDEVNSSSSEISIEGESGVYFIRVELTNGRRDLYKIVKQ